MVFHCVYQILNMKSRQGNGIFLPQSVELEHYTYI